LLLVSFSFSQKLKVLYEDGRVGVVDATKTSLNALQRVVYTEKPIRVKYLDQVGLENTKGTKVALIDAYVGGIDLPIYHKVGKHAVFLPINKLRQRANVCKLVGIEKGKCVLWAEPFALQNLLTDPP
jgi:hypothetical protein